MKILLVASEATPFAKTGGLADVAGSLPKALRQMGHDVRIILPCYRSVEQQGVSLRKSRKSVDVTIDGTVHRGLLRQSSLDGVPVYFIENQHYFDREGLYGTADGDYPDNAQRFGFFCRAVLEMVQRMDYRPDIMHLNDWQTALIAVLLRTEFKKSPFFAATGTLLTIHNLGYQGLFPPDVLPSLGLDPRLFSLDQLEYYQQVSFLKGGVVFADLVNTVSETYCQEIQTPEQGHGFDGILASRKKDLYGIINGLDHKFWDPAYDRFLPAPYSTDDLRGKASNKKLLQRELGLEQSPTVPLIAMVTRLDAQKGLDLLEEAWDELAAKDLQFVLLGSGEERHMAFFAALKDRYPGKVSINLTFNEQLAHRIYAGSDLFLMPSRYEPCGLGQLIALRYGTVPLVRRTGGLADTVFDLQATPKQANGFTFDEPTGAALLEALDRALALYGDRRAWLRLAKRGMSEDLSWAPSAQRYADLYQKCQAARER